MAEAKRKLWVHPNCWKMNLRKPEKYSIINKSKTNSPLPSFCITFKWISRMKSWKVFFRKTGIPEKTRKNHMPVLLLSIHNLSEKANPDNFWDVKLFKPNLGGLFWAHFEVLGVKLPPLKLVRIMLETWNLVCKYTHMRDFRKYTF